MIIRIQQSTVSYPDDEGSTGCMRCVVIDALALLNWQDPKMATAILPPLLGKPGVVVDGIDMAVRRLATQTICNGVRDDVETVTSRVCPFNNSMDCSLGPTVRSASDTTASADRWCQSVECWTCRIGNHPY